MPLSYISLVSRCLIYAVYYENYLEYSGTKHLVIDDKWTDFMFQLEIDKWQ